MADRRLGLLNQLEQGMPARPSGRAVVLAARIVSATPQAVGNRDIPAIDPGAGIPGGRVVLSSAKAATVLDIMAWNTGESSDLRHYGNRTHAENQLVQFLRATPVDSVGIEAIDVELSHSPCTACADMLRGWLSDAVAARSTGAREPSRRTGNRVLVGAPVRNAFPASLRWARLYETQPQATTPQCLDELHQAGWRMAAPRGAIPRSDYARAPITLL